MRMSLTREESPGKGLFPLPAVPESLKRNDPSPGGSGYPPVPRSADKGFPGNRCTNGYQAPDQMSG